MCMFLSMGQTPGHFVELFMATVEAGLDGVTAVAGLVYIQSRAD